MKTYLLLAMALLVAQVVDAKELTLTLTNEILENKRHARTTTLRVQVDGLHMKDCSTSDVDSLQVIHQSESWTATYLGHQGGTSGQLWSGNSHAGMLGGNAKLMAAFLPISTTGRVALNQVLSSQKSYMSCKLTGHIINNKSGEFINIGTFADGTVWAEVMDLTDDSTEREVEVKYGPSQQEEEYLLDGTAGNDDGTIIQMDLPYTGEALCLEAGLDFPCDFSLTAGIISRIIFLIEEMNQILEDSGSNARVQGIRAWRAEDINEPFVFGEILQAMQASDDGLFETPDLLALREQDCADIVGLLTADGDRVTFPEGIIFGQASGIGPSAHSWTFVSSLLSFSLSGFTFTHEIGHVVGLRHNLQADPSYPLISHGYVSHDGSYATLMTTHGSCNPNFCQRMPLFSNPPPALFEGMVFGDAVIADNVGRLEETRLFMSNLRDSTQCGVLAPGPPTPPEPVPTLAPTPDCGPEEELFRLDLMTDSFGSDTSWDIVNLCTGDTVAIGGGYGSNTLYSEHVCLRTDQEYEFTINDSFGDGICCTGEDGYFQFTFQDLFFVSNGEFEHEHGTVFGAACEGDSEPVTSPPTPAPTSPPTLAPTPEPTFLTKPPTLPPAPSQEDCSSCDADLCSDDSQCLYHNCRFTPGVGWRCQQRRSEIQEGFCNFVPTPTSCESCEDLGDAIFCCNGCSGGF